MSKCVRGLREGAQIKARSGGSWTVIGPLARLLLRHWASGYKSWEKRWTG